MQCSAQIDSESKKIREKNSWQIKNAKFADMKPFAKTAAHRLAAVFVVCCFCVCCWLLVCVARRWRNGALSCSVCAAWPGWFDKVRPMRAAELQQRIAATHAAIM